MDNKTQKENRLILIPKVEKYIEYMLQICLKLPRTEKFSIGTEYKVSMYEMLKDVMLLCKIKNNKTLEVLNEIDSNLNTQRIYLRIMKKNYWIDEKNLKLQWNKYMKSVK